jgi:hypothetical protein
VSCRAGLNGPTTGPDWAELNGSCRARPTGCQSGPSTARLMLRTGPGLLPVVLVPGQIMRATGQPIYHGPNFQDYFPFFLFPASRSRPSPPRPDSARPRPSRLRLSPSRHRLALRAQGWRTTHARLAIGLVWSLFELLTSLPLEPGANLASLIWYGWYSAVKRLYLFVIFLNKYRYPSQNSEWSSCFFIQRTILKYRCSVFLKLRLGSFKFL